MEKMGLVKIREGVVSSRAPFYVKCSFCEQEITGYSPEQVVEKARNQNWKYEYEKNRIICEQCLDEIDQKT